MTTIGYVNISMQIWGSVFSLVAALCLIVGKSPKTILTRLYYRMLFCNTASMLLDVLALIFRGQLTSVAFFIVRVANMGSYCCNFLLLAFFVHYLTEYLGARTAVSPRPLQITRALCAPSLLLVGLTQFLSIFYTIDAQNVYRRADWFWASQAMGVVSMLLCGRLLLRHRAVLDKQERLALCLYIVLPVTALILQMLFYGIAFLSLANTVALMLVFLFLQAQQGRRIAEQESRHAQDRIAIMLSQIQPHFLFNALNSIYYLCGRDAKLAQKAVKDFSIYLRRNLDSLRQTGPIPFTEELRHIETYLWLEQLRFGGDLRVEMDIRCENFTLPALTVEPIVENAVQHGACAKPDGGLIRIETEETSTAYIVRVRDDGMGFDPNAPQSDGRTHVGIENVRQRLKLLCGGTLQIGSNAGTGTMVSIRLPKESPNAHHCS